MSGAPLPPEEFDALLSGLHAMLGLTDTRPDWLRAPTRNEQEQR